MADTVSGKIMMWLEREGRLSVGDLAGWMPGVAANYIRDVLADLVRAGKVERLDRNDGVHGFHYRARFDRKSGADE